MRKLLVRVDILVNLLISGNLAERELMSSVVVGAYERAPTEAWGKGEAYVRSLNENWHLISAASAFTTVSGIGERRAFIIT